MIVKKIHEIEYANDVYNLKVKDNNNYFADGLLVSNCHGAKAYSITQLGKKCINTDYRIGLTGTLPSNRIDSLNIKSVLGDVVFTQKSKELIDKGILSKITIANLLLKYPDDVIKIYKPKYNKDTKKMIKTTYQQEEKFLSEYTKRNKIFKFIFKHIKDKENSLILVRKVAHLKMIESYLEECLDDKYSIFIVHGKINTKQRESIRKQMEHEENAIIIATYQTFKQGINIKKLHNIILGSSMKSEITIPQAIGRGLRKHKSKDKMILWDIIDDIRWSKSGLNHVYKHFNERLKLYDDAGFKYFTKKLELDSL